MRQLTSLDTQFLAMEDGRTHGHVSALAVCDRPLTRAAVRDLVAARLHLLAPLRWRLAEVPFDLDYPYWVDDPSFDLDIHVRELALPAPGDDAMLAEQVAWIVSRPLDRSRPLWEIYVIHGLEGGRAGLLIKLHHAAIDGASGAEIMGVLFDRSPDGRDLPVAPVARPAPAMPSRAAMLVRGLGGVPKQPLRALNGLRRALPHLHTVPTIGARAPRTSLNGRISAHRRTAFARLSLDDVKTSRTRTARPSTTSSSPRVPAHCGRGWMRVGSCPTRRSSR
jgi:WS/DGAT/MGAT family acyltransferase